jgi:Ca2+-binding RTX toxin-like protein
MSNPFHILGEKFQVDDTGARARSAPSIAQLGDSRFVLGYSSVSSADADLNAVSGQIFTATGLDFGGNFLLHSTTEHVQTSAKVESLPGGGFVAFWETQTMSGRSVLAQIFDNSGSKIGEELLLKSGAYGGTGAMSPLATSVLGNGNLLLIWNDNSVASPIRSQIYAQNGDLVGGEISINGSAPGGFGGEVTKLTSGGFIFGWSDGTASLGDTSVARIFDANGQPVGDAFQVNTVTAGSQSSSTSGAFADGGFVAIWKSALNGREDIKGQVFAANGTKVGTEFLVNVPDNTYNQYPDVAVLADGTFVVTWQRPSFYVNAQGFIVDQGYGITAQEFDATGGKIGEQFWIDSTNANRYSGPSIEALANGGYVVGWYDEKFNTADLDATGLKARIFGPNSEPVITSGTGDAGNYAAVENQWLATQIVVNDFDVNARLVYSITGGADATRFAINATTGALSWVYPADFEAPADSDIDNAYQVTVRVTDGHASDTQNLTVVIKDVDEAPRIQQFNGSEPFWVLVNENLKAVVTVQATDPEGATVIFTIAGGGDAERFGIDNATGELYFLTAPDFESPNDANGDNIYEVTVQASDGSMNSLLNLHAVIVNQADGLILNGTSKANVLIGTYAEDTLKGFGGNDTLRGLASDDNIDGGSGNDIITGGAGSDVLTGGPGRDTFVYTDISDSTQDVLDFIVDFFRNQGDRVSLNAIDANTTRTNDQAFSFIGTGEFSNVPGQLKYYHDQGSTFVTGDVHGDGVGDFLIQLVGQHTLTANDFIL